MKDDVVLSEPQLTERLVEKPPPASKGQSPWPELRCDLNRHGETELEEHSSRSAAAFISGKLEHALFSWQFAI